MKNTAAADTRKWDSVVEIKNAVKYFDQKHALSLFKKETKRVYALNDVSFSIKKGEFAAYAGPNGAGKSTTFKLLSGMLRPQSGEVKVFGMNPTDRRIEVMRKTGVLFGNRSELWWDHPVKASFEWKKAVWDIDDEKYRRALSDLSELLSLDDILGVFARELSLGQRMRANLALTLLHEPELVLLDEPTLGLDVLAKRQMIEFLKKVNREKQVTILVTSHDMDDLTEMASRILLINQGKIAFDGKYDQLISMTGDRRILKITSSGAPLEMKNLEYIGRDNGKHLYTYDAGCVSVQEIFASVAACKYVTDVEIGRDDIEKVIARLYSAWKKEEGGAETKA